MKCPSEMLQNWLYFMYEKTWAFIKKIYIYTYLHEINKEITC